jgi:hypothetical protein
MRGGNVTSLVSRFYLFESTKRMDALRDAPQTVNQEENYKAEHSDAADHFFSQVVPPSALLQISLLPVETTILSGLCASSGRSM